MISVVIVTYGKANDVGSCLASISRSDLRTISDIVLVDNLGDSRLDAVVEESNVKATVLRPASNLGYGGAINFARPYVVGTWMMILNPDVELRSFDEGAFLALEASGALMVLGPVSYDSDGKLIPSFSSVFPSPFRDPLQELGLLSDGRPTSVNESTLLNVSSVAWISGAAMLLPCSVFDALDGFDPRFFLYYEDVDLCKRANESGVTVSLCTTWTIRHSLHSTTSNCSHAVRWRYRSKLSYFAKHCSSARVFIHRGASVVVLLLKVGASIVWRWRHGGSRTRAYLASLVAYFGRPKVGAEG